MHSRYLRDLVHRHTSTLPLRYIRDVDIGCGGAYIQFLEDDEDGFEVFGPRERGPEILFYRVNNAFVDRLTLSFHRVDRPIPFYLRANANDLQCQIGTLRIIGTEAKIDYALVDFLGGHLKPHTYETSMNSELHGDHATLFTHNALRGTVKELVFDLTSGKAPDSVIPELFNIDVIKSCAVTTSIDPRPWIGDFIRMFETVERGKGITPSVTTLHKRCNQVSPVRHTVDPLGQPRRTDVPAPHSAFIKEWAWKSRVFEGRTTTESNVAELFLFKNAKAAKKLEVFVWTVEEADDDDELVALHYAFLLQVVDM